MSDGDYSKAAIQLEVYRNGTGVLRTVYGWLPVTAYVETPDKVSFYLDAYREVLPSELDAKIIWRASAILTDPAVWNRADDRECPIHATAYSIYCAGERAVEDVTGGRGQLDHRRPAMEVLRGIVDDRSRGRHYDHRLMDYNNDPATTFADVTSLFRDALAALNDETWLAAHGFLTVKLPRYSQSKDHLTAEEIMRRSAIAQHIGGSAPFSDARIANFTESEHKWSELVIVKSPNKLLIRDDYPWLQLTVYRGFDGEHAWTNSNLGGGGLVEAGSERQIKSLVSWYTSSEMVPGRWPVRLARLADRNVDGRPCFTIRVFPEGGTPSTVWIDKRNYSSKAVRARGDRYFTCEHPSLQSMCRRQDIISGGRIVGSIDIQPLRMKIDDIQFEMPEMQEDPTTQWLLSRYAKALGQQNSEGETLRGDIELPNVPVPTVTPQWSLETSKPLSFAMTHSYYGREIWRQTFDGKVGIVDSLGTTTPDSYYATIVGMAYNKCELHAARCGVRVARLANVGIGGRSYYALGVTSLQSPSIWYTLLLDPYTYLPHALWLRNQVLFLADYAASATGEAIPATWTFQSLQGIFRVMNVKAVESSAP